MLITSVRTSSSSVYGLVSSLLSNSYSRLVLADLPEYLLVMVTRYMALKQGGNQAEPECEVVGTQAPAILALRSG